MKFSETKHEQFEKKETVKNYFKIFPWEINITKIFKYCLCFTNVWGV